MPTTSSPLHLADQLKPLLRSLRKQRGLTQAQLGQLLGVSQARVAEIEANPGVVSIASMLKLLSALGAGLQLQVYDAYGRASMAPMAAQGSGTPTPEPPDLAGPKRGSW